MQLMVKVRVELQTGSYITTPSRLKFTFISERREKIKMNMEEERVQTEIVI